MKAIDFKKAMLDRGLTPSQTMDAMKDYESSHGAFEDLPPVGKAEDKPSTGMLANNIGTRNEDLSTSPILQAVTAAIHKGRQTTIDPLMQIASKFGLPYAKKMLEQSKAEDAGDTTTASKIGSAAADIGMQLAPMTKAAKAGEAIPWIGSKVPMLAKAFGMSIPGAAQHQAQDYGKTGEIKPGAAVGEVAANTALMGGGMKVGQKLSEMAPELLQWILKVPGSVMQKGNPPNWKYALENGLVPFRGGAKKMGEQLSSQETNAAGKTIGLVPRLAEDNRVALDKAGVINQIPNMGAQARTNLAYQVGGKSGVTPRDEEQTLPFIEDFINAAKRSPNYDDKGGYLPGRNTNDWRQGIDKNYPEDQGGMARERAAKLVRDVAQGDIDNQMGQDLSFMENRRTLSKATPISIAVKNYLAKPNGPKLLQMGRYGARAGGAGIGASIGAGTDPNRAEGAVLGGLGGLAGEQTLEHLLTTPGGTRLLFEAGKNLSKKSPTRSGLAAWGRYGAYSPSDIGGN